MTEVSSPPTSERRRGLRRGRNERGPRKTTQTERVIIAALGLVVAFLGTIVALIVLAIIVGLAEGH